MSVSIPNSSHAGNHSLQSNLEPYPFLGFSEWELLEDTSSRDLALPVVESSELQTESDFIVDRETYDSIAGTQFENARSQSRTAYGSMSSGSADLRANSTETIDVRPELDDYQALLDPLAYFGCVDDLEAHIIEQCRLTELLEVSHKRKANDPSTCHINATGTETDDACQLLANRVLLALHLLLEGSYCNRTITILVEDPLREQVVRAVSIDISHVIRIMRMISDPDSTRSVDTVSATSQALSQYFFVTWIPLKSNKQLYSNFCCLLLLAILSYTSSHCSLPFQRLEIEHVDSFVFGNLNLLGGVLRFRRRDLQCLRSFIGGPVWVFGRFAAARPVILSISIKQFADLWGPTFAIPSKENFEELIVLKVEGGTIYRVSRGQANHPLHGIKQYDAEIPMHFISTSSFTRELLDEHQSNTSFLSYDSPTDERLPDYLLPFSSNASLLIGHPTHTMAQVVESTTVNLRGNAALLAVNRHCASNLPEFLQANHHQLRPLGTHGARYVPDQLQASFSAGQYVNPGFSKVWRRRPATTYKQMLVEHCSLPRTDLEPILSLNVGVELSICTGNARRVSLRDALILSQPGLTSMIRRSRTADDSRLLAAHIARLGKTGLTDQGNLALYWPLKKGLPDVFEIPAPLPNWSGVLADSRTSACFATMSPRCLTYHGHDQIQRQRIKRVCHAQIERYPRSIFQTMVNFHPQSQPSLPLSEGTRFLLAGGILELRNAALAFYRNDTRVERWRRAIDNCSAPVHSELLDSEKAGSSVLTTCIMDDL